MIAKKDKNPGVWRQKHGWHRYLRHRFAREAVKLVLGRMLRFTPLRKPEAGWSIVLGTPWDLHHLLAVNLRFIERCDLDGLHRIIVVFDRTPKPGGEGLIASVGAQFPGLPLEFHFYPERPGRLVERVNVSTFFNSMNTVTALEQCRTRYAVLHDFDLYPIVPRYFQEIVRALRDRDLRFTGLEHTFFDGLTEEDNQIGTWCLGIDVQWLRANWRPVDCFHKVVSIRGRPTMLDPYAWIQLQTPQRSLVRTIDGTACCHVKNLCSTHLRFRSRKPFSVAWRLHYLWYLESLGPCPDRLEEITTLMRSAESSVLVVDERPIDFRETDSTCENVLRDELTRLESQLFGSLRPRTDGYLREFRAFLERFGAVPSTEQAA